jgi:hypothetical protein
MHLYAHVILRDRPCNYSEQEEAKLRTDVASAPDVQEVKKIERHARGGYSVQLDVHSIQADAFSAYLADRGYSFVV